MADQIQILLLNILQKIILTNKNIENFINQNTKLKSKNKEKDPNYTRKYLDIMLKHAAIFAKDGTYFRLKAHTRENEHTELRKYLTQTKAKQTLEVGFAYGSSAFILHSIA